MFKQKILIAVLALALLVGGVLVYRARALWGTEISIKNNIVKTGLLTVTVDPAEAWFTADALVPGQTLDREVNITNSGSAPADLLLTAKKTAGYTTVFNVLTLSIKDGDQPIFTGPLTAVIDTPLGTSLAPGQNHTYHLALTLPAETDPAAADSYANITFTLKANQTN